MSTNKNKNTNVVELFPKKEQTSPTEWWNRMTPTEELVFTFDLGEIEFADPEWIRDIPEDNMIGGCVTHPQGNMYITSDTNTVWTDPVDERIKELEKEIELFKRLIDADEHLRELLSQIKFLDKIKE